RGRHGAELERGQQVLDRCVAHKAALASGFVGPAPVCRHPYKYQLRCAVMSTRRLTLEERVAARIEGLSPTELRVSAFMREHPEEVTFLSVTELADRLETSDATVIRTAQALGYAGIPDLRRELIEQLRLKITPAVRLAKSLQGLTAGADQL